MGTRKRQLQNRRNNIPGFTAVFAGAYPVLAVPVGVVWLVANGIIGTALAWVIGSAAIIGFSYLILPIIQKLLEGPVNNSGCFIGLVTYGIAVLVLLPLLWWQGGFDMLIFGTLAVPVLVVLIAVISSTLSAPHKPSQKRR